jgi:nicotinamide riboside kinase
MSNEQLEELARLRARVADLEAELLETQAWANEAVGAAQAQTYWLDRWQLDLNELMTRPWAKWAREALRIVRGAYRRGLNLKRRYLP